MKKQFILYILIFFSFIIKLEYEIFKPDTYDKTYQLIGSENINKGHGYVSPYVNPDNLSEVKYRTLSIWPVGPSLIAAPFLTLTGNFFWTPLMVEFFFLIIYFASWIVLFRYFKNEFSEKSQILFWIITGFSPLPLALYNWIDLMAISLFMVSLTLFSISFKLQKDFQKTIFRSLSILVFFSTLYIRYTYPPLFISLFLIYFILIVNEKVVSKRKMLWKYAALTFFLALVYFLNLKYSILSSFLSLDTSTKPFQLRWENLKLFDSSVFLSSVMDYKIFHTFFKYIHLFEFYRIALTLFSLSLFFFYVYLNYRVIVSKDSNFIKPVINLSFYFSFILLAFLISMSLMSKKQNIGGLEWTYVLEKRYYTPMFISLLLTLLFIASNIRYGNLQKITLNILRMLAFLSVLYFPVSKFALLKSDKNNYFILSENKYANMVKFRDLFSKLGSKPSAVFVTNDLNHPYYIAAGAIPINLGNIVLNIKDDFHTTDEIFSLKTKENTPLLVIINSDPTFQKNNIVLKDYISKMKMKQLAVIQNFNSQDSTFVFYTMISKSDK